MFRKQKKIFPAGTFISTPKRIFAIIHLCLAFTVVLAWMGYPFMQELFELKSRKLLYESVSSTIKENPSFPPLSQEEKITVNDYAKTLLKGSQKPFSNKIKQAFYIVLIGIPPFQKAWLIFSLILPVLVLLKKEGAPLACWLLPLIALAHAIDHQEVKKNTAEERLFPSEAVLTRHYLTEPLSSNILKQREQLRDAWNLYLIENWGMSSQPAEEFQKQKSFGELRFNIARMQAQDPLREIPEGSSSSFILGVYILWNSLLAWVINAKRWEVQEVVLSTNSRNKIPLLL